MGKGLDRLRELEAEDYVVTDVKDLGLKGACKVTMKHVRSNKTEVVTLQAGERAELGREGHKWF